MIKKPLLKIIAACITLVIMYVCIIQGIALAASADIEITATIVPQAPPATSNDYNGLWHKEDFNITLSAVSPSGADIKDIYYSINNAAPLTVNVHGHPPIITEGTSNELEYWSVDINGMEELPHKLLTGIKLDKTMPDVAITSPVDEKTFDTGPITITGTVSDALSGIENFEIIVEGVVYQPTIETDNSFTLSNIDIIGGPNAIVAAAEDNAQNEGEARVTAFLGWALHLEIPYYNIGSYYRGAACVQMILNYIREGLASMLTQEDIYNYAHPYNHWVNRDIDELDPFAVDCALGHFDPYDIINLGRQGNSRVAYNFSVCRFENDEFIEYLRDVVHWMGYPVRIDHNDYSIDAELAAKPNVPSMIPIMGIYNNWVIVNGAATDGNPAPDPIMRPWYTPDFTVYGLWLTDPDAAGIGRDVYITAQAAQDTYLLPITINADANCINRYVHVSEPPEAESTARLEVARPRVNEQTLKIIEIAEERKGASKALDLSSADDRIENIKNHMSDAALAVDLKNDGINSGMNRNLSEDAALGAVFSKNSGEALELDWKKIVDPLLIADDSFNAAFDGTQARDFVKVRRLDKVESYYYLIPFDRYEKGQFLTRAAITIDKETGSFIEASWVDEPIRFIQINKEEAISLAGGDIYSKAELAWKPDGPSGSPFYPYWRIAANGTTYLITQDGKVSIEGEVNE